MPKPRVKVIQYHGIVYDLLKSYTDRRKANAAVLAASSRDPVATLKLVAEDEVNRERLTMALEALDVARPAKLHGKLMAFIKQTSLHPNTSTTVNYAVGKTKVFEATRHKDELYLTLFQSQLDETVTPALARRMNLTVRDKTLLIQNSRVLIDVLQQALDYKPRRGDNRPPPDLWIDDDAYLEDVRKLVQELKRLNNLLEKRGTRAARTQSTLNLKKRADTFLTNYAATLGKGAGWLTVALLGTILYEAGFTTQIATKFHGMLK